jgi:hypothetical protein
MRLFRVALLFAAVIAASFLTACSSSEKSYPVRTYSLGERVDLGNIVYTVFETQWLTHLGEGADQRIPQNRFFLVRMTATNGLGADIIVPNISVLDDNEQSYPELSDGEGVPQWIGFLRSAHPAESVQGNLVFDAPPRHYKLKLSDETGDRIAYIDIPLSFGAETPDILNPGNASKQQPSAPISSPATPATPKPNTPKK